MIGFIVLIYPVFPAQRLISGIYGVVVSSENGGDKAWYIAKTWQPRSENVLDQLQVVMQYPSCQILHSRAGLQGNRRGGGGGGGAPL